MFKKLMLSIIGLIIVFSITSFATPYITMNSWRTNEDYQHHCSVQGINQNTGEVLWNTYLGSEPSTELSGGTYLGINNGFAYVVFKSSVYVIDPQTGNIILVNSDFQGAAPAWTFSSSGKLYMGAYYDGPELFIMDKDGKTLCRVYSLSDKFYWPVEMRFTTGNNLLIEFDGCQDDAIDVSNWRMTIDVTKYFGVIEGSINNPSISSYNSSADSIIGKYIGIDNGYYGLEISNGSDGSLYATTYLTSGGYEHSILNRKINAINEYCYQISDSEDILTIHGNGQVDIDGIYYQKCN